MKKRSHSGINLVELRYFYTGIKSLTGLILVLNLLTLDIDKSNASILLKLYICYNNFCMKILMACTDSQTDKTILTIECENNDVLKLHQTISVQLTDRSFKNVVILAIYKDWKKYKKKGSLSQLSTLETGNVVVDGVSSSSVKTVGNCFDDEFCDEWATANKK